MKPAILALVMALPAHADLLFQNQGCTADPTSAAYQATLEPLRQAFREGREVRIYLTRTAADGHLEEYETPITAARFDEPVIRALLPLRPLIDGHANAIGANGLVSGSIDTLGFYRYGAYKFDTVGGAVTATCFDIRWYGDD